MKRFLFQGDSITDASRVRDWDLSLGSSYATVVAAMLGSDNPGKFDFLNKGISGNRIVDLYARIKCDIINLKPDYLSILIGINDVWHEVDHKNGVDAEKFEKIYDMLIDEILEALPDIKIFILEPFVTHGIKADENWDIFYSETLKRAKAAKRISEKYNLCFVPLQEKFNHAQTQAPCTYWTAEGVHPTAMGHGIIAKALLEEIKKQNI